MKIKDTKANKIMMLIILVFLMIAFSTAKFSKREVKEVSIDINKAITIEAITANINIWVDDNIDKVNIIYSTKEKGTLEINNNSKDSVTIKEKKSNSFINFAFENEKPTISIYLPINYYEDINIESVSGNIDSYNDLSLPNININSTSGDISLLNLKIDDSLLINTLSGKINIEEINAKNIEINSTSGNLEIYNITAEDVEFASISGEIYVDSIIADKLDLNVTSSDVELDYLDINNEINLGTVSGDLDLILKEQEYKYSAETVTGTISINENEYEGDFSTQNGIIVNIDTISGEVDINTK